MKFNSYFKEGPYSGECHEIHYSPASKTVSTNCSIGTNFLEVYQGFKDLLISLGENVEKVSAKYLDSSSTVYPNQLLLSAKIKSKIEDNTDFGEFSGSQKLFEMFNLAENRPTVSAGNNQAIIFNEDDSLCTYSFNGNILRITGPMCPDQNDNPVKLVDSVYSYNFAKGQAEIFSRVEFNKNLSHLIPMLSDGVVQEDFSMYLKSEVTIDSFTNKLLNSHEHKINYHSSAFSLKNANKSYNAVSSRLTLPFPLQYNYNFEDLEKLADFISSFNELIFNSSKNKQSPFLFVNFNHDICKINLINNVDSLEKAEHNQNIDFIANSYLSLLKDLNLDWKIYI